MDYFPHSWNRTYISWPECSPQQKLSGCWPGGGVDISSDHEISIELMSTLNWALHHQLTLYHVLFCLVETVLIKVCCNFNVVVTLKAPVEADVFFSIYNYLCAKAKWESIFWWRFTGVGQLIEMSQTSSMTCKTIAYDQTWTIMILLQWNPFVAGPLGNYILAIII